MDRAHNVSSERVIRRHVRLRSLGRWLATLCLVAAACSQTSDARKGVTHALLINGGSNPQLNYQSHLHHLEDMVGLLKERGVPRERIYVFSADGEEQAPDLAVRDALPPAFWLLEGTTVGRRLRPRTELTDTRWQGVTLHPARREALQEWFEAARRQLAPGDRLLIFVTDHGTGNKDDPDNGAISLWQDKLTVQDFRQLMASVRPGVRTVMVMSQCYSGTFASATYPGAAEPSGDACGFFSTTRDLPAYGCYPEGRDRDRTGHAFHFIDALNRHATTDGAHLEVLVTDNTPDVPVRSSDLYLERLVAAKAEAQGLKADVLVDKLLAEAWQDRAVWEPEIRLLDRIGDAFGTFSPRTLAEVETYVGRLPLLIDQVKTYAKRCNTALVSLKEENLGSLLSDRPEWRERLEEKAVNALDAEGRKTLLSELLPQLEWHALQRPEIWQRFEDLRDRARRAADAQWRLEVRRAALLRMRAILVGVAGRVLLAREAAMAEQRDAYERLLSCETLEPGKLPGGRPAEALPRLERFPPSAAELRPMKEALPSWLGVRFSQVPKALRAGRQLPGGASWLQAVYPDSPAMEAGLEAGDIVLGPPERPFEAPGQLREWTITSPRRTPLQLLVLRPGGQEEEFQVTVFLRPFPMESFALPGPPQVGDVAPAPPTGLTLLGSRRPVQLTGRPYLLFFWATWCRPSKQAVPELMAFAAAKSIPVVAITDEDAGTVSAYLKERQKAFVERVATDPLRKSFIAYGVSGTPTIVLVDDKGVVRHHQVGYKPEDGLTVQGWRWSGS